MCTKRVFCVLLILALTGLATSTAAQETTTPPLTELGPFGVARQVMTFVDESRGDWELETYVWYPVDKTKGTPLMTGSSLLKDSPPDRSGAPYPLIVYSHGYLSKSADGQINQKWHNRPHGETRIHTDRTRAERTDPGI